MSRSSIDEGFLTEDDPVSSDDGYTESVLNWQASLRQEWVARSHGDENLAVPRAQSRRWPWSRTGSKTWGRAWTACGTTPRTGTGSAAGRWWSRPRKATRTVALLPPSLSLARFLDLLSALGTPSPRPWRHSQPHTHALTHTHTHAQAHTPALHSDRCLNCASAALFQWDVPGSAHHQ
jgi:hypothetical protein